MSDNTVTDSSMWMMGLGSERRQSLAFGEGLGSLCTSQGKFRTLSYFSPLDVTSALQENGNRTFINWIQDL